MKQTITNPMRLLRAAKIDFEPLYYSLTDEEFSGEAVSEKLGMPARICLKTICTRGKSGAIYVFSIPSDTELDLKLAAKAAGEKYIETVHVKELLSLTGYERGAVSPIGLKKNYPVFIDASVKDDGMITVSAGAKGCSLRMTPDDLARAARASFAPVCTAHGNEL